MNTEPDNYIDEDILMSSAEVRAWNELIHRRSVEYNNQ